MIIVRARDFRESQSKYLKQALEGKDIILSTRDYGLFKIVPISEDDTLMSKSDFLEMLNNAEQEIKEGKGNRFNTAEEAIAYYKNR